MEQFVSVDPSCTDLTSSIFDGLDSSVVSSPISEDVSSTTLQTYSAAFRLGRRIDRLGMAGFEGAAASYAKGADSQLLGLFAEVEDDRPAECCDLLDFIVEWSIDAAYLDLGGLDLLDLDLNARIELGWLIRKLRILRIDVHMFSRGRLLPSDMDAIEHVGVEAVGALHARTVTSLSETRRRRMSRYRRRASHRDRPIEAVAECDRFVRWAGAVGTWLDGRGFRSV